MGSSQPKQQAPTLEDTLIDMKIASKRMARESNKSMKDSQNFMKKAKDALRKNN